MAEKKRNPEGLRLNPHQRRRVEETPVETWSPGITGCRVSLSPVWQKQWCDARKYCIAPFPILVENTNNTLFTLNNQLASTPNNPSAAIALLHHRNKAFRLHDAERFIGAMRVMVQGTSGCLPRRNAFSPSSLDRIGLPSGQKRSRLRVAWWRLICAFSMGRQLVILLIAHVPSTLPVA
jgi:hypothetical protein